jgi:hypothetical protein
MVTAVGVFLIALGAVLAFAVDASVPGVDVFLAGLVMMLVGAAAVGLSMIRWTPRRRLGVARYRPRPVLRRTVRL